MHTPADESTEVAAGPAPPIVNFSTRWQRWRERAPTLSSFELPRRNGAQGKAMEPRDVQRLEVVARGQRGTYRFSPELEAEFQIDMRLSARTARICVALLTFALFVSAPLWTSLAFTVPDTTRMPMTVIQLALMAPLFAALTFVVARYPTSAKTEWFLIGAFVAEMIIVEIIRYVSGRAGFEIEPSIAVTVPVAVMGLARLRVRHCVLFVVIYFVTMLGLARLWPESSAHRSATAWLMEILLLGMVLLSVVLTRLSLRRQWASTRLLEMMAYRDALTGLSNRRAFEDHYDVMIRALPRAEHGSMLFALIDLDHFKALNDHYGHDYGDGALAEVGVALAGLARRPLDMAARIGGEEFALLLYDCQPAAAAERAQAIIETISGLGIEHQASPTGTLTCSAGVVVVTAQETEALSDAYRRADECLYQAKRRGRNTYRLLA